MSNLKDPKISVIVPVYKVEKYFERCVDSIINQTYKNLEIILVDDGSPDLCPVICDKYAEKDSRIIVIHKEHSGVSDARNFGIDAASGEYIAFVDSDDYINENYIEKLSEAMHKDNADISLCSLSVVDEKGKELFTDISSDSPLSNEVITGREVLERCYGFNGWFYAVLWNKLYKRYIFDTIRFPYGKVHEDEFELHNIMYNCKRVSVINERLINYVRHDSSITKTKNLIKTMNKSESLYNRLMFYREKDAGVLIDKTAYCSFKYNYEALCNIYNTHQKVEKDCIKTLLNQMNDIWINERACLAEYSNIKFGLLKHSFRLYFLSVSLKSKLIHK